MSPHGEEPDGRTPGRWAVVLAGGEGERLRSFLRERLGLDRPKQYCSLDGHCSLLEQTLRRARRLAPMERIVTVIGPGHRRYLHGEAAGTGLMIEQPANLETAPGIFLPLARIMRADPLATVVIFPSDHHLAPADAFAACARRAALVAERWTERLVLLAAVPDAPESDYGWIEPDRTWSTGMGAMGVASFREKPEPAEAQRLRRRGGLWNTLIMAAKARTLWEIGRRRLPDLIRHLEKLSWRPDGQPEPEALRAAYAGLEPSNFSREILENSPDRVLALPMKGIQWSDLGRPARIMGLLETAGRGRLLPAYAGSPAL